MSFGRFDRGASPQPMSDINVTPLVDVMLVLVVIFIITAPLLASAIRLDLPKTDGATAVDTPKFVTVAIDKTGQMFLNDQAVTLDVLGTRLNQTSQQNPDTEVQLRADETVPYGKIVEAMGAAQKAGLNHIGFVADTLVPKAAPEPSKLSPQTLTKPN